ncbi:hypothetical protein AXE73_01125 [Gardnerella vaginalis]|uniref:Uncharacterized protein n=1 Tax=Gardnerella vaginalis TaxID=2702 RepID=A0A3E1IWB1_GARVA|nr:hypothetical protein AXE73_01125 [Gardnerella vaginalis]
MLTQNALRVAFSRYALSAQAGWRASKVEIRDFSQLSRRGVSLARYSALTSSLALKAHCAFNFEQAQRIEVHSRATL